MGHTSSTMSFPEGDRRRRSFRRRLSFRSPIKRHREAQVSVSRSRTLNGVGLSEAFNMTSGDFRVDFVNINEATEEQLMTLPGIGRRTARDIVGYRHAIGQFRKVEDLAIVSGVGAAKLATIRSEISVTTRRGPRTTAAEPVSLGLVRSRSTMGSVKSTSGMSSGVNGSLPALSVVSDNVSTANSEGVCPAVDLNTATMFQLMSVRGISQEMAANIVHYREKKGRFQVVEDLSKVKGFNGRLMGEYKAFVTVDRDPMSVGSGGGKNGLIRNGGCLPRKRMSHRRSSSVPVFSSGLPLETTTTTTVKTCDPVWDVCREDEDVDESERDDVDSSVLVDVYEALAARSPRPPIVERFSFIRNGKPALRLATWNLDRFDESKSRNLGVIEVICLTILESGVSLVALQEFSSRQVLSKICQELNHPTLKKVKEWVGPFGTWECLTTSESDDDAKNGSRVQSGENLGFLFDSSRGIEVLKSGSLSKEDSNEVPWRSSAAFSATFKMDTFVVCLLCVHFGRLLKDENAVNSSIGSVFRSWQHENKGSLFIVLGDFKYEPSSKELKMLKANHFTNLVPSLKDNIWISASVKKHFTGHCEVVKSGLSHMAIPKGRWSLGGSASSYFPVWAEFHVPSSSPPSKSNISGTYTEEESTVSHPVSQANGDVKANTNNNISSNTMSSGIV